ncbi:MAG TPA: GAF domain-containing SpoIIE family protein phosphatase [Acidimicrobiia bacterium]|nr:GAF domain-containing SpoIIE family protein phosphatase [Acidimicrobiia bacterium]
MEQVQIRSILTVARALEHARPDDVATVVAEALSSAGALSSRIYFIDYEQRTLRSVPDTEEELDVNGSLAGAAYRTGEVVEIEHEGAWRSFLPLIDGRVRLGVLAVEVRHLDDDTREWLKGAADIVTLALIARGPYGDTFDNVRRSRDLDLATELRYSLLPPASFSTHDFEVAAILEPAYQVAGDGFDYALNGDMLYLTIADAVGHGLASARTANLLTAALRWSRRRGHLLEEAYSEANRVLVEEAGVDQFVTAAIARVDTSTGRVALVNAGHPPPLLLRGRRHVVAYECPVNLPVGLAESSDPPEVTRFDLEPGDALLFYTDGVIDTLDPAGRPFGRERLEQFLVKAVSSDELPSEMLRRLVHSILDHSVIPIRDDACMLYMHWDPGNIVE